MKNVFYTIASLCLIAIAACSIQVARDYHDYTQTIHAGFAPYGIQGR